MAHNISMEPVRRHDGLQLPRSFLFSFEHVNAAPGHSIVALPAGTLSISSDYAAAVATRGRSFVALVGYCIDLRQLSLDTQAIADTLLDLALRQGPEAMLAETDEYLGRFAAICHVNDAWLVFHDACATRSIYYAEAAPTVASHSTLIGRLIGQRPRRELFRHYRWGLPGNASPIKGVRILPANYVLDLQTRRFSRYWPRKPRTERPAPELVEPVERSLLQAADAIATRWKPVVSVTAGLDSRTSIAAFRHVEATTAFTYDRGEIDRVDLQVAQEICRRVGLAHQHIGVDILAGRKDDPASVLADYNHVSGLSASYMRAFSAPGLVHVRANLGEIARCFWRHKDRRPTGSDPGVWVDLLTNKSFGRARLPLRDEARRYLEQELARFVDLLGYDWSNSDNPRLLGYDGLDLIYWEHRMSTWHAQILMGSDFAFETAILFNARRILELFLSAPLKDRADATLFREFVARQCPELRDLPVNPVGARPVRMFLEHAYVTLMNAVKDHTLRRFGY